MTTRIEYAADQPPSALARWASRLAFFSGLLLVAALVLHRVLGLPTPFAMNIAGTAFAGAALVMVMAAVAGLDIWVTGRQGTARVIMATLVASGLLAIPVMTWIASRDWPVIADVTTDTENPPPFVELAVERPAGGNPIEYQKDKLAGLQKSGYPDIKPLDVPRSVDDTFDVVLQALAKMKLKPAAETAPADTEDNTGTIELSDRTLILGFRDDIAIRVKGNETAARVDIRSASRYGRSDFGRNAERIRAILKEIVGRLEATVPTAGRKAPPTDAKKPNKKPVLKRPKAGDRPTAGQRPRPGPSRPATRRAPEQSE